MCLPESVGSRRQIRYGEEEGLHVFSLAVLFFPQPRVSRFHVFMLLEYWVTTFRNSPYRGSERERDRERPRVNVEGKR